MVIMSNLARKAAAAALIALTLGAGLTANAGQAEARYGRKGAFIAAGVIGALALGAAAASAHQRYAEPGYYADPYDTYAPPAPVYREPAPVYDGDERPVYYGRSADDEAYYTRPYHHRHVSSHSPNCRYTTQPYFDGYGYRQQRVQSCR